MQLWGRMAQQQAAHHQQQQQQPPQQQQQQQQLTGLASGIRPHYFAKSPTLSAILAGKPSSSAYVSSSSPPAPLRPSNLSNQPQANPTHQQQAMLASIASQTLLGKLGSAFWDAFSGTPSPGRGAQWDADKVRRVLEGKAVVRVVDIEPTPAASTPAPIPSVQRAGPSVPPPSRMASNLSEKPGKCAGCLVDMFGSLHV